MEDQQPVVFGLVLPEDFNENQRTKGGFRLLQYEFENLLLSIADFMSGYYKYKLSPIHSEDRAPFLYTRSLPGYLKHRPGRTIRAPHDAP